MKKSRFISLLLAGAMCLNLIGSVPLKAEASDTASTVATYPSVQSYVEENGEFSLSDNSRIIVISSSQTLQNEELENDLKLMSSEFTANGITQKSMDIVYGTDNSVKAGDIVVEMADVQGVDNAEEYMVEIGDYIKVTAPNEDGIFYGLRTIQKAFLGNDGKMTKGTIKDWPAVSVRSFHLDNARKFFTKDWIIAMIKDLSWQNINSLQFHFSENEGYRLESSTLEAINGFTYPSDGYLTKQDMLDIIDVCDQYHIELVPSLDSPGHMTYVLNYLPDNYDCTSLWPSDFRSAQTFNIFEVPEAKQVLVDLFTEYADFFSKAGCKHMNIGGDEFLNNFGSMTNEQYVIVMNYFNEIAALVKSYGLTPRVWNDGVMYGSYTGYTFDSDVEICYWSGPNSSASVEKFAENGNKVINYSDVYMYYALSSWWMSNANASGEKIYNEWHPGKLPSLSTGQQTYDYPYTDSPVLGASYALWCDVPNYMTQDAVATNLFMRTRAMAEKSWNPNTTKTYSEFETFMNTLGRVPGYDGQALPAAGQVFYEGEIGNVAVKYVDETGNEIQDSVNIYGTIGEGYEIKAPEIYGYRLTSAASVSGTYTEADQEVTFTYEKYCDKSLLKPEIEGKLPERDYIAETYTEYKEAYVSAKAVYDNTDSEQKDVDDALAALMEAKEKTVSLEKYALYAEAQYPLDSAGFIGGYDAYRNAVNAGKEVLADPDADASAVADALDAILEAKANLQKPDGIVPSITATNPVYTGASWDPVPAGQYALEKMIDNDESTKTWIAENQTAGDEIRFTFPKVLNMTSINVVQPSTVGADILEKADVEVSEDGQTWTKVGELTSASQLSETFTFEKTPAKYVRIVLKASKANWYQISEVRFTYEQEAENTALSGLIAEAEGLDITGVSRNLVSELADALIAAQKETAAGSNDTAAEETALRAAIDAVKNAPDVNPADKKALQATVDAAEELKEEDYTPESWSGFAAILKEAEAVLKDENATQEEVNQALSALDKAKEELEKTEKPDPDPTPEPGKLPYIDVKEGEWFYQYVYDVYVKQLMTGLEDTIFGPGQSLARAQFAIILYRMEGSPEVEYTAKFPDVADNVWYTNAILWAAEAGVVTGYSSTGMFGPSDQITREQMAVMMYRYANYKSKDTTDTKSLDEFPDGNKVQKFAVDGMQWCTAKGIISGKGEEPKYLDPQGSTSRAECATIISRYTALY